MRMLERSPALPAGSHPEDIIPMQFNVQLDTGRIDLGALEQQLQAQDPAAIADFDVLARTLRISTTLDEGEIAAGLGRAGLAVGADAIERQPSTCCGGCGG